MRDFPVFYPLAGLLFTEHTGTRSKKFSAKTVYWRSHSCAFFAQAGLLLEFGILGVKELVADILGFPEINLERQGPDQLGRLIQPLQASQVVRLLEKLFGQTLNVGGQ